MSDSDTKAPPAAHLESIAQPSDSLHYDGSNEKDDVAQLKLDKHGLPLVPQPSDNIDDPLVCAKREIKLEGCWINQISFFRTGPLV